MQPCAHLLSAGRRCALPPTPEASHSPAAAAHAPGPASSSSSSCRQHTHSASTQPVSHARAHNCAVLASGFPNPLLVDPFEPQKCDPEVLGFSSPCMRVRVQVLLLPLPFLLPPYHYCHQVRTCQRLSACCSATSLPSVHLPQNNSTGSHGSPHVHCSAPISTSVGGRWQGCKAAEASGTSKCWGGAGAISCSSPPPPPPLSANLLPFFFSAGLLPFFSPGVLRGGRPEPRPQHSSSRTSSHPGRAPGPAAPAAAPTHAP